MWDFVNGGHIKQVFVGSVWRPPTSSSFLLPPPPSPLSLQANRTRAGNVEHAGREPIARHRAKTSAWRSQSEAGMQRRNFCSGWLWMSSSQRWSPDPRGRVLLLPPPLLPLLLVARGRICSLPPASTLRGPDPRPVFQDDTAEVLLYLRRERESEMVERARERGRFSLFFLRDNFFSSRL